MARHFEQFWGYRSELGHNRREILWLSIPSILGGLFGAWLMVKTNETTFAVLVPYLILLATGLFIAQELLARLQRRFWKSTPTTVPAEADPVAGPAKADPADGPAFGHRPLRCAGASCSRRSSW